jgi:hypothetical protein
MFLSTSSNLNGLSTGVEYALLPSGNNEYSAYVKEGKTLRVKSLTLNFGAISVSGADVDANCLIQLKEPVYFEKQRGLLGVYVYEPAVAATVVKAQDSVTINPDVVLMHGSYLTIKATIGAAAAIYGYANAVCEVVDDPNTLEIQMDDKPMWTSIFQKKQSCGIPGVC